MPWFVPIFDGSEGVLFSDSFFSHLSSGRILRRFWYMDAPVPVGNYFRLLRSRSAENKIARSLHHVNMVAKMHVDGVKSTRILSPGPR